MSRLDREHFRLFKTWKRRGKWTPIPCTEICISHIGAKRSTIYQFPERTMPMDIVAKLRYCHKGVITGSKRKYVFLWQWQMNLVDESVYTVRSRKIMNQRAWADFKKRYNFCKTD